MSRAAAVIATILAGLSSDPHRVLTPGVSHSAKCSYFQVGAGSAINAHPGSRYYVACRFDYESLRKHWDLKTTDQVKKRLKSCTVNVTYKDKSVRAVPADWGPAKRTKRGIDMSKATMDALGTKTDEVVSFILVD